MKQNSESPRMVRFSEMPYERPDVEGLKAVMQQAAEQVAAARGVDEVRDAYFRIQDQEEKVSTLYTLAHIRNTMDTTEAFYDGEISWLREQMARLTPVSVAVSRAFASSPFRKDLEAEFGSQFFRLLDAELLTEDEKIVPEMIREGEISQQYRKTAAQAAADFRGERCNFYGLLKHMESTDREERREAFQAWAGLYEKISPELDAQYTELVSLRHAMARKMGFPSYTEMAYVCRNRFDYTQADAAAFREQILQVVTPAVAEIRERQRRHLGLSRLCFYDENLKFAEGNAHPIGTTSELIDKAQRMYREMSPETGEFFDFMKEYQLFDLETRPGKNMGGYMTRLPLYKAPFIFSNFNGTDADVDVLTHEAGHAFQGYVSMRGIPVSRLWGSTSEINEIHSMTMEHFAYPWMDLFFGDKAEQYRTSHLAGALCTIPYLVSVDEFQHRVYAEPEMSAAGRRAVWREIERKYMPWRDYDGNAFLAEGGFWMQKLHIFLYPFYYIEYALSQICAFQYYGRMKEDRKAAWEDYLRLCRAGGTKGYTELLKIGNLMSPFEAGTVEKSVAHVIEELRLRY